MNTCTLRLILAAWLLLIPGYQAATPLFLQAITSALATIPFSGGPMTTGLIGAKLGIGTKLLYFLGFFGRRSRSKPKPKPAPVVPAAQKIPAGGGFSAGGLQAVPLPYFFSGVQGGGGGFGMNQQLPYGGFDPTQVFQALRAQGYDANTAMQLMNYGGGGFANVPQGGGFANVPQGGGFANVPQGGGFANVPQGGGFANVPQGGGFANVPQGGGFANVPQGLSEISQPPEDMQMIQNIDDQSSNVGESQNPGADDIESFFTFLKDMDENTCISRLVCDIGSDPSFLGEFSENIHSIISSLDVQSTSGAYPYMKIMEAGKREGGCGERFPECSDAAYEVVKNVAPSVGVPQNIDSEAVNQL